MRRAALLLVVLGACQGPEYDVSGDRFAVVPDVLMPSFEALAAAVDDGEDSIARLILGRILAFDPDEETLELALAYERVLDGRALSDELDLVLFGEFAERGRIELSLIAESVPSTLRLTTGGASLRVHMTWIDPAGTEERRVTTVPLPDLTELELPAGNETRVELTDFTLPIGNALAARARISLRLVAGEFVLEDDTTLPAQYLDVRPCELVRLAPFLSPVAVGPEELARYVRAGRITTPALLERAIRIAPSRRREALDLLTPIALELDRVRLAEILPALRWLSGNSSAGGDVDRWHEWLVDRALETPSRSERTRRSQVDSRPRLDLPDSPRRDPRE